MVDPSHPTTSPRPGQIRITCAGWCIPFPGRSPWIGSTHGGEGGPMSQTQPALRPGAAKPTLTERASAGLALVTLAATIAALLVGAVLNWTGTVLALAGVLIGVAEGWESVAHRGGVRVIALVFLAGAAGPFVGGLLPRVGAELPGLAGVGRV